MAMRGNWGVVAPVAGKRLKWARPARPPPAGPTAFPGPPRPSPMAARGTRPSVPFWSRRQTWNPGIAATSANRSSVKIGAVRGGYTSNGGQVCDCCTMTSASS